MEYALLAFYVQLSLYLYESYKLSCEHGRRLRDNYSDVAAIDLSWLRQLTIIFAIVLAFDMALTVPAMMRSEPFQYTALVLAAEALTVFAIGYFSLLRVQKHFQTLEKLGDTKYNGDQLDREFADDLVERLRSIMTETGVYKRQDLRLAELAELVGVSRQVLSQMINQHCGKNFYEFVNEYRVRAAAERLLIDGRANIATVAYESGFNNRVSFNNAFKQHMNMTPSQYRRSKSAQARDSASRAASMGP